MRKALIHLFFCLAFCLSGVPQTADTSSLKGEIIRLSQARFRAFAMGDRAALRDMVADDAIFLYANGSVLNKSQMLDGVARFPGGYDFHYEDVQFRNFQDSVMLCFRLVYRDSTALDVETNRYFETDTFVRRNGRWLLIGVHGTAIPYPKSHDIAVPPGRLNDYVGWYEAGNQRYEIVKEGTQLFGRPNGFNKVRWHAESEDIFAVEGDVAGRRIFIRDKSGRVIQMIRIGPEHYMIWRRLDPIGR